MKYVFLILFGLIIYIGCCILTAFIFCNNRDKITNSKLLNKIYIVGIIFSPIVLLCISLYFIFVIIKEKIKRDIEDFKKFDPSVPIEDPFEDFFK